MKLMALVVERAWAIALLAAEPRATDSHYKCVKSQIRALNCMGIDHKVRPGGAIVVFCHSLIEVAQGTRRRGERAKPNFAALAAHLANEKSDHVWQ